MAASRGADCPVECCVYRRIGAFGLRRSHPCLAISDGPWWSSERYQPPSSVKKPGSSSCELGSPPEFVVPTSARGSRARERTRWFSSAFLGVSLLFATSVQRVHMRWASQAHLRSVHSVSRAHDGLLLAVPCRLVSSCCHVQDSRSRGFLPRPSRNHLVGGPSLLAVGAASLPPVARRRQDTSRRPQGVTPGRDPQHMPGGLAPTSARIPSCVLLLRASLRQPWGRGWRPLRSGHWRPALRELRPLAYSVSIDWRLDELSLVHPPVRASWPASSTGLPRRPSTRPEIGRASCRERV